MKIENDGLKAFQELALPEETRIAGWAALVQALGVKGPVRKPAAVSGKHISGSFRDEGDWTVFDKRYWPGDTFADHLTFALRHEDRSPDLETGLRRRRDECRSLRPSTPTGIPSRRAWYLYELLTGRTLDVPEDPAVPAIDLLDPKDYFTGNPRLSKRHRVRDNLLGTGASARLSDARSC